MELVGLVVGVRGQSLAGEGVVLVSVLVALGVIDDLEVIWVILVRWDKVDEDRLFFTLAVEEELDVFVQIAPFLRFLGLLRVLAGHVGDDVWLDREL